VAFVLNPHLGLTRHPHSIVLHDKPLVGRGVLIDTISAGDAILLTLYDGVRTTCDIIQAMRQIGLPDQSINAAKDSTERFAKSGVLIDTSTLPPNLCVPRYNSEHFAFAAEVRPAGTRLEQPISINYIATRACRLGCRYCYADATSTVSEQLLPLERLLEIIDEAANLGVSTINITGGEPFQRPGIFGILNHIIRSNIYPQISTKAPLDEAAVRRLAEMGLRKIQVSLDSVDPWVGDYLVGRNGHSRRIIATVELLMQHHISVSINSVVTPHNLKTLPDLVKCVAQLGVTSISFTPYETSLGRHDEGLPLSRDENDWLAGMIVGISEQYPNLKVTPDLAVAPKASNRTTESDYRMPAVEMYCGAGIHGFVLLPDGRVSVCERIIDGGDLIIGDLRTQGIMEMWRSDRWDFVCAPGRSLYEGTECYSCDVFELCTAQRRRCFLNSIIAYGRSFGPEPTCPRVRTSALNIS